VFDRAFAQETNTNPSHATMFTGLHPWGHGVTGNTTVMSEDNVTISEILKKFGFSTNAVVASFPLHTQFRFNQGF